MKYGRTRVDDREEGGEVQQAEDADKADVFLVAVCDGAALDGEKDVRICCGGGIVDHRTGRVVEQLDREIGEIPPVIIEATAPVKYEAVNDGTAVELGAKGIEEDARVDGDELDGTASDLKRVGTLEDGGKHSPSSDQLESRPGREGRRTFRCVQRGQKGREEQSS